MTAKELLYIEDALGHEQALETICRFTSEQIAAQDLKPYLTQLSTKHKEIFNNFFQVLG